MLRGHATSPFVARGASSQGEEYRVVSQFVMQSEATYSPIQNILPWSLRLLPCVPRPKYALFSNMYGNEMDRHTTPQLACLGCRHVSQSHSQRAQKHRLTFTSSPVFLIQTAGRSAVFAPSSPSSHA